MVRWCMQSEDGLLDVGRQLPVSSAVTVNGSDPLPELHLGQDIVDRRLAAEVAGEDSLIRLLPKSRRIDVAADSEAVLLVLLANIHKLPVSDLVAVLQLSVLQRVNYLVTKLPSAYQIFLKLLD